VNYDRKVISELQGGREFPPGGFMDLKQLAEWVEASICASCKQGYTCDDFGCDQAKKIADILRRMVPFRGKDGDGKDVTGWLVPD
jgi:hypothetical protein